MTSEATRAMIMVMTTMMMFDGGLVSLMITMMIIVMLPRWMVAMAMAR